MEAGQYEDGGERGDAVLYAIDCTKDPTYEEDSRVPEHSLHEIEVQCESTTVSGLRV